MLARDAGLGERAPARDEIGELHQQAAGTARRQDLVDGTRRDQPAAGHDRDAVGRVLDLRQDVARDEDRAPLVAERPDQLADLDDPAGSSPFAGSSRISSAGILQQRRRDPEPLLHPERIGPHRILASIRETHPGQHPSIAASVVPADAAEDLEVPPAREAREQRRLLHDRADAADHAGQPARHVGAHQPRAAAARAHEPQQAADRRGLAGAVRAQEPEDAAFGNVEVEAVDGGRAAPAQPPILLAEPLDLDHAHPGSHDTRCPGRADQGGGERI